MNGVYLQFCGALLFSLIFLFLWKKSGIVYFRYWALAWSVESLAWIATIISERSGAYRWQAAHAFLEFGFALSLVAAARVGAAERSSAWRAGMRVFYFFPVFILLLELVGWEHSDVDAALRSGILSAIYFYTYWQLGFGVRRLFQFALLALALFYLQSTAAYLILSRVHPAPGALGYMAHSSYYDVALKTLLAFSAMAMWIEDQQDRIAQLGHDLIQTQRLSEAHESLDALTGLMSADALRRAMDREDQFEGVAVVIDLDGFKSINDRFGHMVGDEVLRNIGKLLMKSIRAEDRAYRWGGDEFAILFTTGGETLARSRMLEIEARMRDFQVRGHGAIGVRFSWGVEDGAKRLLREVVEKADQAMYASKREHRARGEAQRTIQQT